MTTDKAPDWFMELFFEFGKAWRAERASNQLSATADVLWKQSEQVAHCARISDDETHGIQLRDLAEQIATLAFKCAAASNRIKATTKESQ